MAINVPNSVIVKIQDGGGRVCNFENDKISGSDKDIS